MLSVLSVICTYSQDITGLWRSEDGTRIYEVKKTAPNTFSAVLVSSTRKTDSIGYAVVRDLKYNSRKERFDGMIYAVPENGSRLVKVFFLKDPDRMVLKPGGMFIPGIYIYWTKAVTKSA